MYKILLMNVLIAAATGRYTESGNPQEADCVIGQSFGAAKDGPGDVNNQLATFIAESPHYRDLPLLLQTEIASALPDDAPKPALVIEGRPSTSLGGELDSWAVLEQALDHMKRNNLEHPLLVAHAFHVGRVALQARKLGMSKLIVPSGLPRAFDPNSTQQWTTSRIKWAMRELPGIAYLRFVTHKL